VIDKINIGK